MVAFIPVFLLIGFLIAMLLIIATIEARKAYLKHTKYTHKSMIFVEYKQTPEGKFLYKFTDIDDNGIALNGSPRLKDSMREFCMYDLEVEKDKYIKGVRNVA